MPAAANSTAARKLSDEAFMTISPLSQYCANAKLFPVVVRSRLCQVIISTRLR
jgi:hypothetical protein